MGKKKKLLHRFHISDPRQPCLHELCGDGCAVFLNWQNASLGIEDTWKWNLDALAMRVSITVGIRLLFGPVLFFSVSHMTLKVNVHFESL